MRRLFIIAMREYLSYARTGGFWLSLALMPLALGAGALLPGIMDRAAPVRSLTLVDLTNQGFGPRVHARLQEQVAARAGTAYEAAAIASAGPEAGERVERAFEQGGPAAARQELARVSPDAARAMRPPPSPFRLVAPPEGLPDEGREQVNDALRAYVAGELSLPGGGQLDAAAVIYSAGDNIGVDLWTADVNQDAVEDAVRTAVREEQRRDRLTRAGLPPDLLQQVEQTSPDFRVLSPKARGEEVSLRDRLPSLAGFALGMALWSAVLTGAGILLNSVMEEKANRVLEILAASATTTEIMGGKILGVAALTLTVLGGWALLGGLALSAALPGVASDLGAALLSNGLLGYFALYAVFGYLMYAAAFAAIGAFCETTRDAQALLGPVMVLLTVPVVFMGLALREPDAEILRTLSWIPPFTPFLMMARAAGDPAWWEIAGTLALMAVTTIVVVHLSGRAFHAGALSTSRPGVKAMLGRLFSAGRR